MTEKELVVLGHNGGREQAVGELYIRYGGKINNFIFNILKNKEDAEDITQDVFRKVYENINKFEERSKGIAPWLFRIARNSAVNYIRKEKKHKEKTLYLDLIKSEHLLPPSHLEPDESAKILELLMEELPSEFRNVMKMNSEGFSYQESAYILRIPAGTFRSRLDRAKNKINSKSKSKKLYDEYINS